VQLLPSDEPPPLDVETSLQAPLIDPVTGEDLGVPLPGIVDLVLDGQDGPVICDFKTAASSAAPLELGHEIQLTCYAYLLRQATGLREAGLEIHSLIKTKKPQCVFHRFPAHGG
jgi:ATP-dependent exoDNAse (exonuclease V) beta subunit